VGVLGALRRRRFLTATEREQLQAGLVTAQRHAGAPLDLLIDERAARDHEERAREAFHAWQLPEGERPRAVLVYACAATRRFAVIGGDEIRRVAPQAFWENLDRNLRRHFEEERYCDGLFKAVADVAIMQHSVFVTTPRCHSQPPPPPEESDP
jgi:uncharacterized membrane protein